MNAESQSQCFTNNCSRTPKYYCCYPARPVCSSCSQLQCHLCHIKPNKPLKALKKQKCVTISCLKCMKNITGQSITFPCKHSLCLTCICVNICQLIKSSKEMEQQSISCSCSDQSICNIGTILMRYCFCCGQSIEISSSILLKNGLRLRTDCKNRLKYQSQLSSDTKKPFLTRQLLQRLLIVKQQSLQPTQEDNFKEEIKQKPFKKIIIIQKPKTIDKIILCIDCGSHLQGKSDVLLCHLCLSKHKTQLHHLQKKQTSNQHSNDLNIYKQSAPMKKQTQRGQRQKPQKTQKLQYERQYQRCVSCDKKQYLSVTNTVSQQIGSFLCSSCFREQNDILQRSTNCHLHQQSNNNRQKKLNPYLKHLDDPSKFYVFGKNIRLGLSVRSQSSFGRKEEDILPSIIQELPDPVEMQIQYDDITSCWNCGLFLAQTYLTTHNAKQYCLTCFMLFKAINK